MTKNLSKVLVLFLAFGLVFFVGSWKLALAHPATPPAAFQQGQPTDPEAAEPDERTVEGPEVNEVEGPNNDVELQEGPDLQEGEIDALDVDQPQDRRDDVLEDLLQEPPEPPNGVS